MDDTGWLGHAIRYPSASGVFGLMGVGSYFVSSFNADLRWSAQAWSVGIVGFQSKGFEVTLPSTLISNSTASISPIIFLNLPDGMAFQFSGMLLYFGFSLAIPIGSPLPSTGVSTNSRPDLFFCSGVSVTVFVSTAVRSDDIWLLTFRHSAPFPPLLQLSEVYDQVFDSHLSRELSLLTYENALHRRNL